MPFKLLVTLLPICGGVALSTVNDTEVSMDGAFWALAGLLAAAGYQVLVKSTQENLEVGSFFCSLVLSFFRSLVLSSAGRKMSLVFRHQLV